MPMTRSERSAYARGYQVSARRWPAHKPPVPPQPVVAELMQAMEQMCDQCATFIGMIEQDDAWAKIMAAIMERGDKALSAVSAWVRDNSEGPS